MSAGRLVACTSSACSAEPANWLMWTLTDAVTLALWRRCSVAPGCPMHWIGEGPISAFALVHFAWELTREVLPHMLVMDKLGWVGLGWQLHA